MYKVYKNVEMTKEGYLFGIENKEASEKCAPGQYFELKLSGDDHRVPTILTDILSERGIIKVVFRPIKIQPERWRDFTMEIMSKKYTDHMGKNVPSWKKIWREKKFW